MNSYNEGKEWKLEILFDKMKTYTYNKSTVWFLSTPIQIIRTMCGPPLIEVVFFFVLVSDNQALCVNVQVGALTNRISVIWPKMFTLRF